MGGQLACVKVVKEQRHLPLLAKAGAAVVAERPGPGMGDPGEEGRPSDSTQRYTCLKDRRVDAVAGRLWHPHSRAGHVEQLAMRFWALVPDHHPDLTDSLFQMWVQAKGFRVVDEPIPTSKE